MPTTPHCISNGASPLSEQLATTSRNPDTFPPISLYPIEITVTKVKPVTNNPHTTVQWLA